MWLVYVIKSLKSGKLYKGYTSDLKRRLSDHNNGMGGSFSSKNMPFELVFYEAFRDKKDAMREESFLKSGKGRELLKGKLKYSLNMFGRSA